MIVPILKKILGRIRKGCKIISGGDTKTVIQRAFPRVNKDAVFVFGNQKSGTTVIAALLSDLAELSSTLDIRTWAVEEQDLLHQGRLSFEDFVHKHRYEFSSELIKEPALTFLYDEVRRYFTLSKAVFVIRDPRDNIRSILNRVNRSGRKATIENLDELPEAWQRIVDNRWMGLEYDHYIDSMAARWNRAADVYLEHADEMILARYEDFVVDKVGTIEQLAQRLGLPQVNDVSAKVDIQYQPRGKREVSWEEFFGQENLERIERICSSRMKKLGYSVEIARE
ncbi:MAG: sulfotransferase [Chloroflexota bacterium]|nr:sulfotransferase [Chloroflexota bacterium]